MALGLCALLSQLRTRQSQLAQSNQRLDELNRDLEARVEQRTAELRLLNGQLEELALTDALTELLNRRALVDLIETDHGMITITASCGVTLLGEYDQDPEQLLRRADEPLYAAKLAGRDRVIGIGPRRAQSAAAP